MMKTRNLLKLTGAAVIALVLTQACTSGNKPHDEHGHEMSHAMVAEDNGVKRAICVLQATEGNDVAGIITFTQTEAGMVVTASVTGLTPGKHGFHIHEFGDVTAANGTSAGGHFNPGGHDHGAPHGDVRHVGDLGNLEANEEGIATYEMTYPGMTFNGAATILGRGIIVHADEDDLVSQPTGAAGARVAMGVIGVAKSE